jgi:putative membrane protein
VGNERGLVELRLRFRKSACKLCNAGVRHELMSRMYISAWITDLNNRNILNASFASPIMTCIMELQKALSDLDKLATTPIPSAYSFHLKMTVLLYLFFLPFQLQQYLNWVCIPATAIASIVYLGFLEIGNQIEMPFAYDQSDLDLDKYVLKIAMQLAEITAVSCGFYLTPGSADA